MTGETRRSGRKGRFELERENKELREELEKERRLGFQKYSEQYDGRQDALAALASAKERLERLSELLKEHAGCAACRHRDSNDQRKCFFCRRLSNWSAAD